MKHTKHIWLLIAGAALILSPAALAQTTIPAGDDTSHEIPLPFTFPFCGTNYDSVWVNSNGNITFGGGDSDFTESTSEMLLQNPRVAGFWDDLSPNNGGSVSYVSGGNTLTVSWDSVPEFFSTGSNSFSISLKSSGQVEFNYGSMTATDGLVGISCGGAAAVGTEAPTDISTLSGNISLRNSPALYEQFSSGTFDLAGTTGWRFNAPNAFVDTYEPNGSLGQARNVNLPFSTADSFSELRAPAPNPNFTDADYYEFQASAGDILVSEVVAAGQVLVIDPFFGPTYSTLDTVMGLFDPNGTLIAADDDGGSGLLSKITHTIPADGRYAIAVARFGDFDFNGVQDGPNGTTGGARYVLDILIRSPFDEIPLDLGDDTFQQVSFLCGSFTYQGTAYSSVYVNSNGNLTFGSGDSDFSESVSEFLNDQPRIAGLWDDLSPNNGGEVTVQQTFDSMTVRFKNVPEFFSTGSNTFTFELTCSTGDISLIYGTTNGNDGIVGVTEGGGAANPGATDLSGGGPYSKTGTTYEQFFSGGFDLDNTTVDFN